MAWEVWKTQQLEESSANSQIIGSFFSSFRKTNSPCCNGACLAKTGLISRWQKNKRRKTKTKDQPNMHVFWFMTHDDCILYYTLFQFIWNCSLPMQYDVSFCWQVLPISETRQLFHVGILDPCPFYFVDQSYCQATFLVFFSLCSSVNYHHSGIILWSSSIKDRNLSHCLHFVRCGDLECSVCPICYTGNAKIRDCRFIFLLSWQPVRVVAFPHLRFPAFVQSPYFFRKNVSELLLIYRIADFPQDRRYTS